MRVTTRGAATVLLGLATASCVLGPAPVIARNVQDGNYCGSQNMVDARRSSTSADDDEPEEEHLPAPVAATRYTARALDTARAIGAVELVERLAQARAKNAPEVEIVDLRSQINDVISLASLDIASTVAHIQCEEGRAEQLAEDLRAAEQEQNKNLTFYSIILGAVGAIASSVLAVTNKDTPVPSAAAGIGAGAIGGFFGFATLAVTRHTTFKQARNILGQLWTGDPHPDFPDVVWAYLTRPEFSPPDDPGHDATMRDFILQSWRESDRLGGDPAKPDPDLVALYFGDGGEYDTDGLDNRAAMLSEVREAVNLMSHDLQHLASEIAHR